MTNNAMNMIISKVVAGCSPFGEIIPKMIIMDNSAPIRQR